MSHHTAKSKNKKFLEKCPDCGIGYMIHTTENRYRCNKCSVEATMDEYHIFWFDDFDEYDFYEDDLKYISVYDAALIWAYHAKDEDFMFGYSEDELESAL